jgi:hypothetical protein
MRGASVLLAAALATAAWASSNSAMNSAGVLHTVSVESRTQEGSGGGGTRLVHRVQQPNEIAELSVVPGTDEATLDVEPSISISPSSGLPALVWSRLDGAHYKIYFSLYSSSSSWSTPRALTANSWDDRTPQIVWAPSGYIHIMWLGPLQLDWTPAFYETILDVKGATVVPPTQIRTSPSSIESAASIPSSPTFRTDDVLFAFNSTTKVAPRVTVQGGQDEPIPVSKRVDLELSGGVVIDRTRVRVVNSSLVVFARAGSRLFYWIQTPSGWISSRSISLDTITEEGAELLVTSMIAQMPAN